MIKLEGRTALVTGSSSGMGAEIAKALAREQIEAMTEAMLEVARMADEVATGGEAYPVGVRELASRMRADLESQAKSIEALLQRT